MRLIGVDVGGTFTDLVYADTEAGETAVHKVSTTPDDPSRGVVAGLMALCDKYGIPRETIDWCSTARPSPPTPCSSTTARVTGMITTDGYRDILHIGRHQRPQHYSIMQEIPWQDRPLVKRRHRKTVNERLVPPKGEVLVPLDEDGRAPGGARAEGRRASRRSPSAFCSPTSIPAHEERARAIVREEYPGVLRHDLRRRCRRSSASSSASRPRR